jgi:hypothetical protein
MVHTSAHTAAHTLQHTMDAPRYVARSEPTHRHCCRDSLSRQQCVVWLAPGSRPAGCPSQAPDPLARSTKCAARPPPHTAADMTSVRRVRLQKPTYRLCFSRNSR